MRKMPEIKAENGFVTSIDGNAIPRTKLYMQFDILTKIVINEFHQVLDSLKITSV